LRRARPGLLPADIRNYLARYLFTEDDVFRTVETLSGGERGRLALAVLALSNANLLLLDEPTNHLDLPSQEILQHVLSDFNGTILLVTHDRYLVDALASQVWEVKPEAQSLLVYEGSYSEYKSWLSAQSALETEKTRAAEQTTQKTYGQRAVSREERERKKQQYQVEVEIASLEAELQSLEEILANPPQKPDELRQLTTRYSSLQKQLEQKFNSWARLAEKEPTSE
jgi:ATP-binding cassette, subfamily F, member 3